MRFKLGQAGVLLSLAAFAVVLSGCGQSDNKSGQVKEKDTKGKSSQVAQTTQEDKKDGTKQGHSWWCDEHGVPEEICGQCSAKVAAEFKKKGDWCKEHDRPESQCFICHPELKKKFAAQYRAKYGKEPPPTEDEEKSKKDDKK